MITLLDTVVPLAYGSYHHSARSTFWLILGIAHALRWVQHGGAPYLIVSTLAVLTGTVIYRRFIRRRRGRSASRSWGSR